MSSALTVVVSDLKKQGKKDKTRKRVIESCGFKQSKGGKTPLDYTYDQTPRLSNVLLLLAWHQKAPFYPLQIHRVDKGYAASFFDKVL